MTFTKSFASILLILVGFSIASGQNPAQVRKLKKELAKITGSKEFKTATIGFCLMDVETGKILVEENAEKSLIPASTMKLITTGAGLALLGDTFRFKTQLSYVGTIENKVLNGEIYIKGMNDPTTGSNRWPETNMDTITLFFTEAIKKLGINKINGRVVAYADNGDNIPPDYGVGDLGTKYGAPPYGLNFKENYTYTTDTTVIVDSLDPSITRYLVSGGGYTPYNENGIPSEENPPLLFAKALSQNLEDNGIEVTKEPHSGYMVDGPILNTWYSKPLVEITTKTNQQSINLFAESILRVIPSTPPNYIQYCISSVTAFWKTEVGDIKGLRMTDGSGLSRSNLCTPLLFCKMLTSYTKRDNFNSFYSTIPIAGREGTVKNFAKGTAADGNAHIKSGSMSRVKCYAGYVTGKNGKLYAVSVMFNNFEPDVTVTAACANLIGKVAELKGGKPKRTFVVNRGK